MTSLLHINTQIHLTHSERLASVLDENYIVDAAHFAPVSGFVVASIQRYSSIGLSAARLAAPHHMGKRPGVLNISRLDSQRTLPSFMKRQDHTEGRTNGKAIHWQLRAYVLSGVCRGEGGGGGGWWEGVFVSMINFRLRLVRRDGIKRCI